jgi:hypothetical protein
VYTGNNYNGQEMMKVASNSNYVEELITVKQMYEVFCARPDGRGVSEKFLRARGDGDILVFVDYSGGSHLYDKLPSIIRILTAKRCKRPGVSWKDIKKEFNRDRLFSRESIVEMFHAGDSEDQIVACLAKHLSSLL